MNLFKILKNGIVDENPTFVQVLGMCPTLAVTTSAVNGLGMGLATTAVLAMSNFAISGATITSSAVTKGVNTAIELFKNSLQ